jgi:hypothetical protein
LSTTDPSRSNRTTARSFANFLSTPTQAGGRITYLRLLDANAQGADWREVARVVLHLDPEHDSDRARRAFERHLSRAKWMTEHGYRHLLRGGALA